MTLAIDRFLSKVHRPHNRNRCWTWLASTRGTRDPRGCFWNGYKNVDAARWIYQHQHPFADLTGKVVMHRCDNSLCVNPDHLTLGTQAENVADMHAKRRAHQQTDPSVGRRAAQRANETMDANPGLRQRGERHWAAKISASDAQTIRVSPKGTKELAEHFEVSRSTIQRIRSGQRWSTSPKARASLTPERNG